MTLGQREDSQITISRSTLMALKHVSMMSIVWFSARRFRGRRPCGRSGGVRRNLWTRFEEGGFYRVIMEVIRVPVNSFTKQIVRRTICGTNKTEIFGWFLFFCTFFLCINVDVETLFLVFLTALLPYKQDCGSTKATAEHMNMRGNNDPLLPQPINHRQCSNA